MDYKGLKVKINKVRFTFHWTLLFLFFWMLLNGYSVLYVFTGFLLTVLIITVHETGHAYSGRKRGCHVRDIVITGWGGFCRLENIQSTKDSFFIGIYGILFQFYLGTIALGIYLIFHFLIKVNSSYLRFFLLYHLVYFNAFLIFLNFLPLPGFDGEIIWSNFAFILNRKLNAKLNAKLNKERLTRGRFLSERNNLIKQKHNEKIIRFTKEDSRRKTQKIMEEIRNEVRKKESNNYE